MTKRLQVLFHEAEWRALQRAARAERTTVSEWVRRSLRRARGAGSPADVARKSRAIRAGARHAFPVDDLERPTAEMIVALRVRRPAPGAPRPNQVAPARPLDSKVDILDLLLEERQAQR